MKGIRKTLVILGVFFLIIASIPVSTREATARLRIFKASSEITIKPDKGYFENVSLNEEVSTNLTITYSYSRFSIPSGYFLLNPSPTRINLEVVRKPEWCEVYLDNENLSAAMPLTSIFGGNISLETGVTIKISSKSAPGYKEERIVLMAKALDNGNINSSKNYCEIRIKPGFYPDLDVNKTNFILKLSPGEERNISMNVINNGNMEIRASITPTKELPDLVILDMSGATSIDIKPGETKTVKIGVKIKEINKEINERYNIPLELSYHAKEYEKLKGDSLNIDLILNVKGEPKSILHGFDPVFIEAIIIIILVIALAIMITKYRS